jgi:lipopolysaccharide transport system ATP-binding protein
VSLAIAVAGVSKRFLINHATSGRRSEYRTLRESLTGAVRRTWNNLRQGAALGAVEEFWALHDVSFDVRPGEVIGVIGRNGAGKSTLLKILTRITEPTSGRAVIRGRVGSLLEVGTGFHPELTGRENVFLNGSILGMTRQEIKRNFDTIVDFSGVEQFIDTPVKRYSSGMKVRLAFAIASHLDLEVMLVDEVLAVGDAEFQRKCLGKMDNVAHSGRTILFVSHNMAAVQTLCHRCVLLEHGRVVADDVSEQVVARYLHEVSPICASRNLEADAAKRYGTGEARFVRAELQTLDGSPLALLPMGQGLRFRLDVRLNARVDRAFMIIHFYDDKGIRIGVINSQTVDNWTLSADGAATATVECTVPSLNLMPGRYRCDCGIRQPMAEGAIDYVENAAAFEITPTDVFGTGHVPRDGTVLFMPAHWQEAARHSK